MEPPLIDSYGRILNYLRISVTDQCNLRCAYCLPPETVPSLPRQDLLTAPEIERIARMAISLGMTKIRITGGEPLVRPDIENLLSRLGALPGMQDYALSTNGILLAEKARAIYKAGIQRVNLGLDSLHPERFKEMTRKDEYLRAIEGLNAIQGIPFRKIKINMVVVRDFNDDEILEFARLTLENPLTVRFIELMPVGQTRFWDRSKVLPFEEIKARVEILGPLEPISESEAIPTGPEKRYRIRGAKGDIGFITPISDIFCASCNRLRLTPDGKLRGCLFSAGEVDLKGPLRKGASDEQLRQLFFLTAHRKPEKHCVNDPEQLVFSGRFMSQIGG